MNDASQPIENLTTSVWLDDDGVLFIRSKGGVRSTTETVLETLASVRSLTGGKRVPLLIDARKWDSGDAGALQTMVDEMATLFTAAAMVIDPKRPPSLGAFPDFVNRLIIPFQLFSDPDEALAFLLEA